MRRHFPFLLGRLPRIMAALNVNLVTAGCRYLVEILLAVPFVAFFYFIVVGTWADKWFYVQEVAIAIAVLPLSYLVLILMIRPRRGPTKVSPSIRDDEV